MGVLTMTFILNRMPAVLIFLMVCFQVSYSTSAVITAAEAFIDEDPGEGNGFPLQTASDGVLGGTFEQLKGEVGLDGLELGIHILSIRYKDSTGLWSLPVSQTFYTLAAVSGSGLNNTTTLTGAIGKIDNDLAISIPADDGNFDDFVETVTLRVPVKDNYHSAKIRFQDGDGILSLDLDHEFSFLFGDLDDSKVVDARDTIIALQVLVGQTPIYLRNDYLSSGVNLGDNRVGLEEAIYSLSSSANNVLPSVVPIVTQAVPVSLLNIEMEREDEQQEYESQYARIVNLQKEVISPENEIDQWMLDLANPWGIATEPDGDWMISYRYDNTWGDRLNVNSSFNTVFDQSPGYDQDGVFEVVSVGDEEGTNRGTKNRNSYYFSYDALNDGIGDAITIEEWVDYLEAIKDTYGRIGRLTIFTHGNSGFLSMSDNFNLTTNSLLNDEPVRTQLSRLRTILSSDAHILLFSCQVAKNTLDNNGTDFIQELANLTGATVHANSDNTGPLPDDTSIPNDPANYKDWSLDAVRSPNIDGFIYPVGSYGGYGVCPDDIGNATCYWLCQDFQENVNDNCEHLGDGNHLGEDWNRGTTSTDTGDPLYAIADGEVVYADMSPVISGWGPVLIIRHTLLDGSQIESLYGHLNKFCHGDYCTPLEVGDLVAIGDKIGTLGDGLGSSTSHLHFEIRLENCPDWGQTGDGYNSDPTGWVDPSNFIDTH